MSTNGPILRYDVNNQSTIEKTYSSENLPKPLFAKEGYSSSLWYLFPAESRQRRGKEEFYKKWKSLKKFTVSRDAGAKDPFKFFNEVVHHLFPLFCSR